LSVCFVRFRAASAAPLHGVIVDTSSGSDVNAKPWYQEQILSVTTRCQKSPGDMDVVDVFHK
jgi:hypothetical protein